jgi:hypothetical protein
MPEASWIWDASEHPAVAGVHRGGGSGLTPEQPRSVTEQELASRSRPTNWG